MANRMAAKLAEQILDKENAISKLEKSIAQTEASCEMRKREIGTSLETELTLRLFVYCVV